MNFRNYQAKDVDDYIANVAEGARAILKEVRKVIKATIPSVEEKISWGVPFYRHHGMLAGFAALKNHVSFGLVTVLGSDVRKALEGKGYVTGKKTIQIRFDQKVPTTEIGQILMAQAKVNVAKSATK